MKDCKCILGLDIGTTNISAVVMDVNQNRILETHTEKNNSQLSAEDDFSICDAEKILQSCRCILDSFIQRYPNVAGIGITGQMHGILYVDEHGKAVSPLYTWQDGRGNRLYSDGRSYCEEIKRRTGYSVYTGYGYATLFYNHENGLEAGGKCVCGRLYAL